MKGRTLTACSLDRLRSLQVFTENRHISSRRPFIYISAEDIFRPLIPVCYIARPSEASYKTGRTCAPSSSVRVSFSFLDKLETDICLCQTGLVYHALRPLTTPLAASSTSQPLSTAPSHAPFQHPLPFSLHSRPLSLIRVPIPNLISAPFQGCKARQRR